jgi:hypothetical protein
MGRVLGTEYSVRAIFSFTAAVVPIGARFRELTFACRRIIFADALDFSDELLIFAVSRTPAAMIVAGAVSPLGLMGLG